MMWNCLSSGCWAIHSRKGSILLLTF